MYSLGGERGRSPHEDYPTHCFLLPHATRESTGLHTSRWSAILGTIMRQVIPPRVRDGRQGM